MAAKVELARVIEGIHGKLGHLLFREQWGKQTVMPLPDYSKRKTPPELVAQNDRMRLAGLCWRTVKQDPELRAAYYARARALNKPVFAVFYGDFCAPPCVREIDASHYTGQIGETISVKAEDEFGVRQVQVIIHTIGGNVVEDGLAEKRDGSDVWWDYRATARLESLAGATIEAVATDWPGNCDRRFQPIT